MAEEEILKELRTLRTLVAIDKEEDLKDLTSDLSDLQRHILNHLDFTEWQSLSTSEIAESFECGTTKVRNHRSRLENRNLIAKKGEGSGAKYRKTGLLRSAEQIGVMEE